MAGGGQVAGAFIFLGNKSNALSVVHVAIQGSLTNWTIFRKEFLVLMIENCAFSCFWLLKSESSALKQKHVIC